MVSRLALVGTGLIGASVGLGAKRAGVAHVTGWDPDGDALRVAGERGAHDAAAGSVAEALADAELAVVAAPVAVLPEVVRETLAAAPAGCTVTDVGSTKTAVTAAAAGEARFIGGHPICGSEARGPERASAELFAGATWFLTPTAGTEPGRYAALHGFVTDLGARPIAIPAGDHDRLVAITSHLPHALANLLIGQAGDARVAGHEPLAAAGGSLRDMTRVAGANPRIWVDIFLDNRDAVAAALAEHRRRVERLEAALAAGDAGFLARWIADAAGNRRRMLATAYDDPADLFRLRVHVPDRPGVLAGITQALGAERINIEDFELRNLSPERGGTLTLLVSGREQAERAAAELEAQGYSAAVSRILDE